MKKSKPKKVVKKTVKTTKKTTKKVKKLLAEFCVDYPWGSNYMEEMQAILENGFHVYPDEWLFGQDCEGMFVAKNRSVINRVAELFDLYNNESRNDFWNEDDYYDPLQDKHDQFWNEISKMKGLAYMSQDWKHLDVSFDKLGLKRLGLTLKEVSNDGAQVTFKLYKD
jgi:hypothetical protein